MFHSEKISDRSIDGRTKEEEQLMYPNGKRFKEDGVVQGDEKNTYSEAVIRTEDSSRFSSQGRKNKTIMANPLGSCRETILGGSLVHVGTHGREFISERK